MPNRSSKKRPRDINQLAKYIVDLSTGEIDEPETEKPEKNPAAVSLGRLGGLKGGKARAAKLTSAERSEIAKKAAEMKWARYYEEKEKSKRACKANCVTAFL
ncbi:MAG TPA: hypothetical protein PKE69_25205 [Pyrinomonadaceae bacterium]|nr:hypothetical protein [Pyrinomonadaceae bacterium]